MTDIKSDRVAPGYLGDGVSPSNNDKNLHHILTAEEREAIKEGDDALYGIGCDDNAATLRNLLERMR